MASRPPIVIVGAGFAGLCMAIELRRRGVDDLLILEADDEVGGTWRDNTYPGCACDIPSHLYSFSFEQNPRWSRAYSPQAEIQDYLVGCTEKYGLYERIRFGVQIQALEFEDEHQRWAVESSDGRRFEARAVVLAIGGLSRPKIPDIPGLSSFEGPAFHSARWDHDADLEGKRVGLVGTGASAVQIASALADEVDELTIFQRTPPWVMPRPNPSYSEWTKRLFETVPGLQRLYRSSIYLRQEAYATGFVGDRRILGLLEWFGHRYRKQAIADDELRDKVTPDYPMGCKRIVFSDDYYPTLTRHNVQLVDAAVASVEPRSVVDADGRSHDLDALVLATGFHVTDFLESYRVRGRGDLSLHEAWSDGAQSYYGINTAGFPNLFMMVGPNTGLGHNSIVFMIEAQAHLIGQALEVVDEGDPWSVLEVRRDVQRRFNDWIQRRSRDTVWLSGCDSWYLDEGKNTTLWPSYTVEYWRQTRRLERDDFLIHPAEIDDL